VKLLVIDALAELFHSSDKTSTQTLIERSQNITEISLLLHSIASQWDMAIVVLNEVVDVFDRGVSPGDADDQQLDYRRQVRWFGRADSIPGQDTKEAALGLVWANQLNARIMLSRTGRRRYLGESEGPSHKRQKQDNVASETAFREEESQPTLIRRLTVIFSSVGAPLSLDYIVTTAGISTLPSDELEGQAVAARSMPPPPVPVHPKEQSTSILPLSSQLAPLDVGVVEDKSNDSDPLAGQGSEADEWDEYWASDPISDELYHSVVIPEPTLPATQFVESSQAEEIEMRLNSS
jgi:DNA repair protein RAD57